MIKKMKKSLAGVLAVALMLIMGTGVCFANDGLPVLEFEHNSYIGSANSTITVGAIVTNPDNSKPMKGVKVSFTLKDSDGNKTSLGTEKSDGDGMVACDVPLGENFPYKLIGSASDGVNVTKVKIKADKEQKDTTAAATEPTEEDLTVESSEASLEDDEDIAAAEKSVIGSFTLLIIILITVVIIAAIVIILVVRKGKKKDASRKTENKKRDE